MSIDGDVWGEDSETEEGAQRELSREQRARDKYHYNTGYREGLEAGKERTLQAGFDIGFKEGAEAGFKWGSIRATAKTLELLCGQVPGTSQIQQQAHAIAAQVHAIPAREAMLGALHQQLTQPIPLPPQQQPHLSSPEPQAQQPEQLQLQSHSKQPGQQGQSVQQPEGQSQGTQGASGGDVELEQAFARLSSKQQHQQHISPESNAPPIKLPDMDCMAKQFTRELSILGFCPPSISNRGRAAIIGSISKPLAESSMSEQAKDEA